MKQELSLQEKRKWIRAAFWGYKANKTRLPFLEKQYEEIPMPTPGGGFSSSGKAGGNGVEKSMMHYLFERNELERLIQECKNKISLVEKTVSHLEVEDYAKGRRYSAYLRCRFMRGMSYTAAAVECEIPERTAGYWLAEIMNVAYAIAEMEKYI